MKKRLFHLIAIVVNLALIFNLFWVYNFTPKKSFYKFKKTECQLGVNLSENLDSRTEQMLEIEQNQDPWTYEIQKLFFFNELNNLVM